MLLKIKKIKEQKDGSALVDIDYGKEFSDLVKKLYNRKRCTKKLIERAVNDGLRNYIKIQENNK